MWIQRSRFTFITWSTFQISTDNQNNHKKDLLTRRLLDIISFPPALTLLRWYHLQTKHSTGSSGNTVSLVLTLFLRLLYMNSLSVTLWCGTRCRYPLTPFLFAMNFEPLTTEFEEEGRIWGHHQDGQGHTQKLSLYADDVLLYTSAVVSLTEYKDGWHDSTPKVKSKHLHRSLMAGCSIAITLHPHLTRPC